MSGTNHSVIPGAGAWEMGLSTHLHQPQTRGGAAASILSSSIIHSPKTLVANMLFKPPQHSHAATHMDTHTPLALYSKDQNRIWMVFCNTKDCRLVHVLFTASQREPSLRFDGDAPRRVLPLHRHGHTVEILRHGCQSPDSWCGAFTGAWEAGTCPPLRDTASLTQARPPCARGSGTKVYHR